MEKVTGRIENWSTHHTLNFIAGHIYDDIHQRWVDGTYILTSNIKGLHNVELKEGDTVVTTNSTYLLGKPHANF